MANFSKRDQFHIYESQQINQH